MSFLNPSAFFLLILIPIIVLFYFLKLRRTPQIVPSTYLWETVLRDRQANTIFQKLQRDILLLLQIMIILMLIIALSRPTLSVARKGSDRVVLIVDTSVSMKATDIKPDRFSAAMKEGFNLISKLPEGAEMMIIEASSHPVVKAPFSRDKKFLRKMLSNIKPLDIPGHLHEAVETAIALTKSLPASRIYVLTDGTFDYSRYPELKNPKIDYLVFAGRGGNVAITSLSLRKSFFATYDYQAFISLINYSDEKADFGLSLTLNDTPINNQRISLDPGVKRSLIIPISHQGSGIIKAKIDVKDDLEIDNIAYSIIFPPRQISILLFTEGNLFLEKALKADPQVKLEVKGPESYSRDAVSDVIVLDSFSPVEIGDGRYILINSVPGNVPLELLGKLEQPAIIDWNRTHPVMRFVDFSKVVIEESLKVRPLSAGRTLVESGLTPLIFLHEEKNRKFIFVGFDLFKSDIPLRVAFPLILSNSLRWLHPANQESLSLQVKTGQPFLLPLEHGIEEAVITDPEGNSSKIKIDNGLLSYSATSYSGLYNIETIKGEQKFAVNVLDGEESNISPKIQTASIQPESYSGETEIYRIQIDLSGYFLYIALCILFLEAWIYWKRRKGKNLPIPLNIKEWGLLAFRISLIVLIILSLTGFEISKKIDKLNVIFLLDYSDSISWASREMVLSDIRESTRDMKNQDKAGVLIFGSKPQIEVPVTEKPAIPNKITPIPGKSTDIGAAVKLALAAFPRTGVKRIVLFSDGIENTGSALEAAQMAKNDGVDLYYIPSPFTFQDEVILEQIILPQEVKYGESFILKVVAKSLGQTTARLSLYKNGQYLGSQSVMLSPGKNVFSYKQSADGTGIQVYQALLETGNDTIDENNRAIGITVVRGKPLILYVEKDLDQGQHLMSALRSQNIDVEIITPGNLSETPGGYQKYDSIIFSNVSALKLTRKTMDAIRDYVKDYGGGFVMIGGEESFGLGGYYRTSIEEALPVTMETRQKIEVPNLAVMLILDRSGSMSMGVETVTKLDIAKEAAHLVVELLDERNEVGVLSFDTEFTWVVPLKATKEKDKIAHEIASIKSGGGTDAFPAMKEAYKALYESKALLKHIMLLSDGQTTRADYPGLLRRMIKDKITVSTVAIGRDADVKLMLDISRWGKGRFYYTEDLQTIPRIFTMETQLASKTALVEQPFKPEITSITHDIVENLERAKIPPLGGYVATSPKATGDVLMMTHREDPLLAAWRYGLGRSAAFTSDAKAKWGILWLRWPEFGKFWSQVIRWTLKTAGGRNSTTTVELKDNQGIITIDALDGNGEFINFMDTPVGIIAPDKNRNVIELEQFSPGKYRGSFDASEQGVYLIGLMQKKEQKTISSQIAGLVVPYSPEFRDLGVDESFLKEISSITGGGAISSAKEAFSINRKKTKEYINISSFLIFLTILLFMVDVALRKTTLLLFLKDKFFQKR